MPRRRRMLVSLLLAVGLSAGSGLASANVRAAQDAKGDTTARADDDLRKAGHGHTRDGRLRHRITTYGTTNEHAPCVILAAGGTEYGVCSDGSVGNLEDFRITGEAKVRRPDEHTIVYIFSKKSIGNPSSYRWYVEGVACSDRCDRLPDSGKVRHALD